MLLTIINNILVALTMHVYNSTVFSAKRNSKTQLVVGWCIAALIFSSQVLFENSNMIYNLFSSVLPFLCVSIACYKASKRRIVFFVCLYYILAAIIETILYLILCIVFSTEQINFILSDEKFTLIHNIFVWFIIRLFSMLFNKESYEIELVDWFETIYIPIGSIFLVVWCFAYKRSNNSVFDLIGLLILLLFNIISYFSYIRMQEKTKLKYRAGLLYNQNQCYLEETRRITYLWKKISEFEHNDKYTFTKLVENNETRSFIDRVANSGNFVIDSIINNRAIITENENINFEVNLMIPYDISLCQNDMSILLCNLIDNAIEANYNIECDRWIKIDIRLDKHNSDTLLITVANPYNSELKKDLLGDYISSKADSIHHGIGMQSIKNIVNKHYGELNITDNNHIFKVDIILFDMHDDVKNT